VTVDILIASVWGILVAGTGAFLTELTPWYRALRRPSWQPPDWLFGPAWTVILACASVSLYLGLRQAETRDRSWLLVGLFVLNGVLNIVWSPLFFRLRRPDWALAEVPLLWLSILVPMVLLLPVSRTAGLLMLPYLLWVSFAAFLNLTIVRLNQPFGV
jgi:tryptophan-rich sensory protein